jgi:hypothetical protein
MPQKVPAMGKDGWGIFQKLWIRLLKIYDDNQVSNGNGNRLTVLLSKQP